MSDSNRNSSLISLSPSPDRALAVDALILVLCELALLDGLFPARAIALGPLAAEQIRHRRLVVPGAGVGLALVLALLVDDDLLLLAARAQREGRRQDKRDSHDLPLGAAGCCAGGCAPGFGGRPYAVLQPHTSEPRPRR